MNIQYIKNIFDKNKEKDFSSIKKQSDSYSKKFTLPLSILFFYVYCFITNYIFNIYTLLESKNYIGITLVCIGIFLLTKYTFIFIKSYKRNKYINYLIKENKELYEIYKEVLFYKYQNNKKENTFLIYLSEFKELNDEEIQEYINTKNELKKIKNSLENDEDLDLFK